MDKSYFETIFTSLNTSQKKVVESIYGSYMVVAGPGTGKTQTLSARTAHILLSTDIAPENILITSFTEAGVSALKKRLFNFIGAASYRVCVTTLHSLAQDIIERYPEHFLQYRALSPLDELESYELIEQVLKEGSFPILSPVYDPRFYVRDAVMAIAKCREEWVQPTDLIDHIRNLEMEHQEILMSIKPTLVKYTSTATKQAHEIAKLRELQRIYAAYTELKRTLGRYDFSDMILHAAQELKTNTHLALELAERYQIVMVDEFQDLSNSQSSLIEWILRAADEPNIMTVGDDDQSIYRFQGANLENMLHFCEKYPSTEILVLSDNYRSHEEILKSSRALISNNSTRLSALIPSLVKPLTSVRGTGGGCSLVSYADKNAEMTSIIDSVRGHLQEWVPADEIALLVRKNAEVREWVGLFSANGIPVQSNLTTNLLQTSQKRLLADLLRITILPKSPSDALIELLRIGFFEVPRVDLYRITRALEGVNYSLPRKIELFEFMLDDMLLEGVVGENLSKWTSVRAQILALRSIAQSDLITFLRALVAQSGITDFVRSLSGLSGLESLYDLLAHIEMWANKNKLTKPVDILNHWDRMEKFNLALTAHSAPRGEGVWIITAHQSKGLEYAHVFMPGSLDGVWSNSRNNSKLTLPVSIAGDKLEKADINEEERRLYFVAMTRARDTLQISFPESDMGRAKLPALFTTELWLAPSRRDIEMNPEYFLKSYELSMYALKLERSDREFIQAFFANYSLSPTDLSRFLNSPEEFLQRSILRYPFEDTLKTLFGVCYHGALEVFYKTWKLEKSRPSSTLLTDTFTQKLGRYRLSELEHADALERGIAGLQGFYELTSQSDVLPLELEYSTSRLALHFEGIPIKGKIDRIDEISPGKLRIIDYKTGTPKSENALMGKTATGDESYLRQLLFYKLMIESDPRWSGYTVDEIAIWYVEGKEGKYPLQILTISDEIEAQFRLDLHAAWAQITSIDWWMSYFWAK